MKLLVLASGRGSNFNAILDGVQQGKIPGARVVGLLSNNPSAKALEIAKERGIPAYIVDPARFRKDGRLDRGRYEAELVQRARSLEPDLVCLAGYMLLLGPALLTAWPNRIVNIHPSLLPSFRGLHAQRQALEYGCRVTGCTVHFVNEELDGGPIIAQSTVDILDGDTEETLSARLLPIEHKTYVDALAKLCSRGYEIAGRRVNFR